MNRWEKSPLNLIHLIWLLHPNVEFHMAPVCYVNPHTCMWPGLVSWAGLCCTWLLDLTFSDCEWWIVDEKVGKSSGLSSCFSHDNGRTCVLWYYRCKRHKGSAKIVTWLTLCFSACFIHMNEERKILRSKLLKKLCFYLRQHSKQTNKNSLLVCLKLTLPFEICVVLFFFMLQLHQNLQWAQSRQGQRRFLNNLGLKQLHTTSIRSLQIQPWKEVTAFIYNPKEGFPIH